MTEDEKLSGYLDGELDPAVHADLTARMAGDDRARARLAQLRETDALVRTAYADPLHEALPDRFIAALDKGIAADATQLRQEVVATTAGNDNAQRRWLVGGAIAASLAVGLLLGSQFVRREDDVGIASAAFGGALSATPSLQSVSLASGERLTPSFSFARAGGGYCRQFELTAADLKSIGIACTRNGAWMIEALLPSAPKVLATEGYATAEGPANPGLDMVIASLRQGDPLDRSTERSLIAHNWK